MKWLRRIFGVLDTSLCGSILLVGVYWFTWLLDKRYIRILSKELDSNSKEVSICLWILVLILVIISMILKYQKLRKKNARINIVWFVGFTILFAVAIQVTILNLCSRFDIMDILLNELGDLR